jgi:hypothetical protein
MKKMLTGFASVLAVVLALFSTAAVAQEAPELNVNSPAVTQIRDSLKARVAQIKPLLDAGTLGFTQDGKLAVRDPAAVPLSERQKVLALITGDNNDKAALYREIARANGHPEWEQQIADKFKERFQGGKAKWIRAGWWVQDASGNWTQKVQSDDASAPAK